MIDPWALLEHAFGWGGVIAYHGVGDEPHLPVMHVSPARLRAQLEFLRDRHTVVSLRELTRVWRAGTSSRDLVAITFDDAYVGVLTHALPILRDLDIPATVFVTSSHAALGAAYWWDDVDPERSGAPSGQWLDVQSAVGLSPDPSASQADRERLRDRVLAAYLGRWPGRLTASSDALWRSLSFLELETLARDERIDFGVHTLSHPALPLLSHGEQVAEMRDCFRTLRERLPRVLPIVAYPYGLYDASTVRAAAEAGMQAAVTMEGRATADRPEPLTAPRIGAGDLHSPHSLDRRLSRALRPLLVARNRGRHPRLPRDPAPSNPDRGRASVRGPLRERP